MVNWTTVNLPIEEIQYEPPIEWMILRTANSLTNSIKRLTDQYSIRNYLDYHDSNELNRCIILLEAMKVAHGLVGDEDGGFKFA